MTEKELVFSFFF